VPDRERRSSRNVGRNKGPAHPSAEETGQSQTVEKNCSFAGLYVTALSQENGFTVYTVALGAYDLFPVLQQYVGPYPHINQPTSEMVYVDRNTQPLNHGQINPGSLLRFRGLVFDDNSTMRMELRINLRRRDRARLPEEIRSALTASISHSLGSARVAGPIG
jgi:hypothetical protein